VFERNNNISVNCYKNIGKDIIPIYQTTMQCHRHVNLLYVEEKKDSHFILIQDLSLLLGKHTQKKHFYCSYCQKRFLGKDVMNRHSKECRNLNLSVVKFPKANFYKFKHVEYTLQFPFVLYYDFECFSVKKYQDPNDEGSLNTVKERELIPSGYSIALVGPNGYLYANAYDGSNPVEHFIGHALFIADQVKEYINNNKQEMTPTAEELKKHRQATNCLFCQRMFTNNKEDKRKVIKNLHHNHVTRKVIGSSDGILPTPEPELGRFWVKGG